MKINNLDGRCWISQFDGSGQTIHITNREASAVNVKGTMIVVTLKKEG